MHVGHVLPCERRADCGTVHTFSCLSPGISWSTGLPIKERGSFCSRQYSEGINIVCVNLRFPNAPTEKFGIHMEISNPTHCASLQSWCSPKYFQIRGAHPPLGKQRFGDTCWEKASESAHIMNDSAFISEPRLEVVILEFSSHTTDCIDWRRSSMFMRRKSAKGSAWMHDNGKPTPRSCQVYSIVCTKAWVHCYGGKDADWTTTSQKLHDLGEVTESKQQDSK